MTTLIFVYGTLKRGLPNHYLLEDKKYGLCKHCGTAVTKEKFPLVVASDYNVPFMLHVPGSGAQIVGELYEVDKSCLTKLDELEAHPHLYERMEVRLTRGDSTRGDTTRDDTTRGDTSGDDTTRGDTSRGDAESNGDHSITAEAYFLAKYKPYMLELPRMQDYANNVEGKEYISPNARGDYTNNWWAQVHMDYPK